MSAVRVVFWIAGWFAFPLLYEPIYGDRYQDTGWESYKEMAWRNPTNGMKGWWKQPVPETKPNPDHLVRVGDMWNGALVKRQSASRWMRHGLYWEYWYLRQIDWKIPQWVPKFGGKHYQWFEIRFGWKFVDGNDEFFPTLQFAPHSS